MKIIGYFNKLINDSLNAEKKSTPSARLFNIAGLCCSLAATILLIIAVSAINSGAETGLRVFAWIFYFALILVICAVYLSVIQRLRGRYLTSILSIILCILCTITIISVIIAQQVRFGRVYINPFGF